MKLQQRLKIVIPVVLLAAVLLFAFWYFTNWYKPTGAVIPGAPMELMKIIQNDREIKIIKKGKEEIITIPEGKPYRLEMKYPDKIFFEQTVIVNGIPMKGICLKENGISSGFTETFHPGEKKECVMMIQVDWQVEKHRLMERYRGKVWRTNISVR